MLTTAIIALVLVAQPAIAQDDGDGGAKAAPAPQAEEAAPAGTPVQGFQYAPSPDNTYIVTYDLRGLQCVNGASTPDQCAVPNQDADEGGYPWTKVKCGKGDRSVHVFAWSIDRNQALGVFEAPPQLIPSASTYKVNARIGRVCLRSAPAGQ